MKSIDLSRVQTREFGRTPAFKVQPGAYVCEILAVQDVPEKEYLKLSFDICEGEGSGFYADRQKKQGYGLGAYYASYREDNLPNFKSLITALKDSNPNFNWNNNEQLMVGKKVGIVFGAKEFQRNPNEDVIVVMKPRFAISVERVHSGEYNIPKLLKLKHPDHDEYGRSYDDRLPVKEPAPMTVVDASDDLPF